MTSSDNGLTALPANWVWSTIGEVYDIVGGGTPSTSVSEYWTGNIPWITSADIHGPKDVRPRKRISAKAISHSTTNVVPAGSLIVVTRVGLGKVAIAAEPLCFSQDSQALVRFGDCLDAKFALYYLSMAVQVFKYQNRGTTIAGVTKKQLAELPFPLAPRYEQKRIVQKVEELLTQLEAAVDELSQAQAQLKPYRQAVLKSAVTGELTREWREAHRDELEPASELFARILKQRRVIWEAKQVTRMKHKRKVPKTEDWKNSYREPVKPNAEEPEGFPSMWSWVTWDQIGLSQNGRLFPSNQYQSTGVKLLRPGNLHFSGKVVWTSSNTRYMPRHWEQEFSEFIIQGEELVVNLTAQSLRDEFLGRVCLTDSSERCLLNQRIARLMPIKVSHKYLLYVFKSEIFRRFVNTLNTGSLIQHMFTSQLSEFCLPLPSLEEQEQIVAEVERCLSIADAIEQNLDSTLAQADQMRASILKQAFEGKLVPQDPNDEPAELLLERIRTERAKREAEKQAEAKSNRKRITRKRLKRTERPAA